MSAPNPCAAKDSPSPVEGRKAGANKGLSAMARGASPKSGPPRPQDPLSLLDALPGMAYQCSADEHRHLIYASGGCRELTGRDAQELTKARGPGWWSHTHPDDRAEAWRAVRLALRMAEPYRLQYRIFTPDGQIKWIADAGRGVWDDQGRLVRLEGFVQDITDQVEGERRLRAAQQNLARIIDLWPDPAWVIDAQGKVVAWNKAIERLTGVAAADIVGKGDYEYALPFYGRRRPVLIDLAMHWDPSMRDEYLHLEQKGDQLSVSESYHPLLGDDGLYLAGAAAPLFDADGQVIGAIETARDITEAKHAAAQREELIKRLEVALAEVKTLSGLLPICSSCKKVRDDGGYWQQIEHYISQHSQADFSHSICPDCARRLYPGLKSTRKMR